MHFQTSTETPIKGITKMRDTEEKLKLKFHFPSIDYFALTFGSFK